MNPCRPRLRTLSALGLAGALAAPAAAQAPTASIQFVAVAAARAQQPQPDAGTFVLDLGRLESAEAARDLVTTWQRQAPGRGPATCWLLGPQREDLLRAVRLLTSAPSPACDPLRVGVR